MRKKLWLHTIWVCFLFPFVCAPLTLGLWYRDGDRIWIAMWILLSVSSAFSFFIWSAVIAEKDNVALKVGDSYVDLGQGNIPLGLHKLWSEAVVYNPRPRDLREKVSLPVRDGTVLSAKAVLTWKPDRKQLGHFLEDEPETRLSDLLTVHLQKWSKQLLAGDVYFDTPPPLVVPGIVCSSLSITDIAPVEGKMNQYIWDSTQLINSVINEIQDENKIETKRAELLKDHPDKAKRINQLVEQRKAALRKRGLRENR